MPGTFRELSPDAPIFHGGCLVRLPQRSAVRGRRARGRDNVVRRRGLSEPQVSRLEGAFGRGFRGVDDRRRAEARARPRGRTGRTRERLVTHCHCGGVLSAANAGPGACPTSSPSQPVRLHGRSGAPSARRERRRCRAVSAEATKLRSHTGPGALQVARPRAPLLLR